MLDHARSAGLLHDRHLEILVYILSEQARVKFFEGLVHSGHLGAVQSLRVQHRLNINGKDILKIPKPCLDEFKELKSWNQADDFLWPKLSMSRHRYTTTVVRLSFKATD